MELNWMTVRGSIVVVANTPGRMPYAEPCGGSFLGPGRSHAESGPQHQTPNFHPQPPDPDPTTLPFGPGIWTDQMRINPSTN